MLDARSCLGRSSTLDEPEAALTVGTDTCLIRSSNISTIESSDVARRSREVVLLGNAQVVESTVEVGYVECTIAALTAQEVELQVVALALGSHTDSHTALLLVANVGDTSSLVELAAREDRLPRLVEVLGINLPDGAGACSTGTSHEETTVLREAEVLQVECVAVHNSERCLALNVETAVEAGSTVFSVDGLEVLVECEESTNLVSTVVAYEAIVVVNINPRLSQENLTEALACRIVVDGHTVGAPNLVAANLDNVERALACNSNLIRESRRIVAKCACRNLYAV